MAKENGKCPSCGGALLLDATKEKAICEYCGNQIIIEEAVKKIKIDGIADFDTRLLSAKRAIEFDEDFDKAAKYYRQALELRPDDYRALWGAFLCEISAIKWAKNLKGYVQIPGDIPSNVDKAFKKFADRAYSNAPDDVKTYYNREMQTIHSSFVSQDKGKKKKGCYIATAVYGSYDCPEVWVLRRYRDNNLQSSFFGRLFIKIYYALSPAAVRLFGKKHWFNVFWKKKLDKKVARLKDKGYQDTPYND